MKRYWSYTLPKGICTGQLEELKQVLKYQYRIDLEKITKEIEAHCNLEEMTHDSEELETLVQAIAEKIFRQIGDPWYEKLLPRENVVTNPIGETEEIKKRAKSKDIFFLLVTYAVYLSAKDDEDCNSGELRTEGQGKNRNYATYLNVYRDLLEDFSQTKDEKNVLKSNEIEIPVNFNNSWYQKKDKAIKSENAGLFINYEHRRFFSTKAHYNYLGFVNCELNAKCPVNGSYGENAEDDSLEITLKRLFLEKNPFSCENFEVYAKRLHAYFHVWFHMDEVTGKKAYFEILRHIGKGNNWKMLLIYENILPFFSAITAIQKYLLTRDNIHKDDKNGLNSKLCDKEDPEYFPSHYPAETRLLFREIMRLQNIFIIEEIIDVYWFRTMPNCQEHIICESDIIEWGKEYEMYTTEGEIWSRELREAECYYYPILEAAFIGVMEEVANKSNMKENIAEMIDQLICKMGDELEPSIFKILDSEKLEVYPIEKVAVEVLNDFYYEEQKYGDYRINRNTIDIYENASCEQNGEDYEAAIRECVAIIRNAHYDKFDDEEDNIARDEGNCNPRNKCHEESND